MLGLDTLGITHTLISLVAVAAGLIALVRDRRITWGNGLGKVYAVMTVLTCITGFFIFHHGGFGKPHVLGIVTLVVIAIALAAQTTNLYGRWSAYVATVGWSLTFFFHMIPGFTETLTRLPLGAPLLPGPDAPELQAIIGVCFVIFLIGATLQVLSLRKARRLSLAAAPAG